MTKSRISTEQPLFSILIANYNNGHYLQECLDSVFAQTYTNWEVIIVDDGSTDEKSFEIYKKYQHHSQIHIYSNQRNKGCGYTKRRCVELANGEICGYLDPDDTIASEALKIMVRNHLTNPLASLVYSTHFLCDEDLKVVKVNNRIGNIIEGESYLSSFGKGKRISAFAAFKTKLYNSTNGINPRLKRAVDQDLYYKLEEVGAVNYIDKPLYYYRFYRDIGNEGISTSSNAIKAQYWHLLVIDSAIKRRRKMSHILSLHKKDSVYQWEEYFFTLANKCINNKEWLLYYKNIFRTLLLYPSSRTLLKFKLLLKPTK